MVEIQRPIPKLYEVDDFSAPAFTPAPELLRWVKQTFLDEKSALFNPAHDHLNSAALGFLWAHVENVSRGRAVGGTAEMPNPKGNKWQIARQFFQLQQWFGGVPDFVITIDAPLSAQLDDASFCALIEHELYHCAQATDLFGFPKFKRSGQPVFTMKGHDVEEFVGVVRRYGAGATAANVQELVAVANREPELMKSDIATACGVCLAL